jgi:hypothetical protein
MPGPMVPLPIRGMRVSIRFAVYVLLAVVVLLAVAATLAYVLAG